MDGISAGMGARNGIPKEKCHPCPRISLLGVQVLRVEFRVAKNP